jgi:DNA-binding MarR family transcriptional regulator
MPDSLDPRDHDERARQDGRESSRAAGEVFTRGLDLPNGLQRERVYVHAHDADYYLRGSEVRALATIGAFRVVSSDDLHDDRGRRGDIHHGDLARLKQAGLIRVAAPFDRGGSRGSIVTLTERGRETLESHRAHDSEVRQTFYAGAVKTRELSHDAQVYRAYLRVEARLRADGARVHRVVLDYELKREYQTFLQERNRGRSDSDGRPDRSPDEIRAWADEHGLPVVDGHLQFPDLRVEYERADGRSGVEDVEVTTLHYRGQHAAGKVAAGFTRFRAGSARVGGSKARAGAAPFDPDVAGEVLS